MIFLSSLTMPSREDEEQFFFGSDKARRTCYTTKYPFGIFRYRNLPKFEFSDITMLYGGNGSGKSTILNVIAEHLKVKRGAIYNRSDFFDDYVQLCNADKAYGRSIPETSRIITSDDVFDYLLDIRCINEGVDTRRAALFDKYINDRKEPYQMRSLDEYEEFRRRSGSGQT